MSTKQKAEDPKKILPDIKNIKSQETYTLPSKGLVYEENENIPASITLRRMTTKEDKMRMRNETEDKIRRDILQACIMNEGVDAGRLKLADANFLLFKLRILSLLDDTYKVRCFCNNCTANFIHEIKLSEIPVNYLTKDALKLLKLELPLSKQQIDLKYPSLNDIIKMSDRLKVYFEQFPNVDKNETVYTTSIMLYIDKINNQDFMLEELEDWVDNLDIIDNRALRDFVSKLDKAYGFGDNIKALCPKCGNEVIHGLPITNELFTPSI